MNQFHHRSNHQSNHQLDNYSVTVGSTVHVHSMVRSHRKIWMAELWFIRLWMGGSRFLKPLGVAVVIEKTTVIGPTILKKMVVTGQLAATQMTVTGPPILTGRSRVMWQKLMIGM